MVTNPVYEGRYAYWRQKWERRVGRNGKPYWTGRMRDDSEAQYVDVPAIVTKAEAKAAALAIAERRRRHASRRTSDDHPFTLRSLLSCGACGGPLAVEWNNGYRYYRCLRNTPRLAKLQHRDVCSLPSVPAEALEAEAFRIVSTTLLDADHLRAGLTEARKANRAARRRREQIDHLRAEVAARQRALEKQTLELLKAESGSIAEDALRKAGRELEREIGELKDSLRDLESRPVAGLSADDVHALEQFAEQVRADLVDAEPGTLHSVYKLLQLRGMVRIDAKDGIRLSRRKRLFAIDWSAVLELRHESTRFTTRPGT
jgi:hypothetical protein